MLHKTALGFVHIPVFCFDTSTPTEFRGSVFVFEQLHINFMTLHPRLRLSMKKIQFDSSQEETDQQMDSLTLASPALLQH